MTVHTDVVTLPGYYLLQIANQLDTMGQDAAAWLRRHGLQRNRLGDDAMQMRIGALHQLIADARALANDPALGLLVGQRLQVSNHGLLGYAAMNCGSLRQLTELFERFTPLRTSLVYFTHEYRADTLRLQLHLQPGIPLDDTTRLVIEAVVLGMKNVLDFITLGSRHMRYVAFPFGAAGLEELAQEMFRCPVHYDDAWAGFALPVAGLDAPLKMADPGAFRQAAAICEQEMSRHTHDMPLSTEVRRLLLESGHGFPSLQVTARLLHMTPRTLHRHLVDEGSSYKNLLRDVRHLLALEHLKTGQLSIKEIAHTLGYSDMANFRRAFRQWEGCSPSDYRVREHSAAVSRRRRPRRRG